MTTHQEPLQPTPRSAPRPGTAVARVIVPLDGSSQALVAVPVAKALAELDGAALHVVHVSERVLPPRELLDELGVSPSQLEGSIVDELTGTPAEAIVALAHESPHSRIVMSAQSHPLRPGRDLAPVTEEVLAMARCPVVLVRPEQGLKPWQLRRILLPHDGNAMTASAFGPAVEYADRAGATLFVLHVATLTGPSEQPGSLPVPQYVDQPQHEWPEWTREFIERMESFCEVPEGLQPRLFVTRGEPGREIAHFSEQHEIDLIGIAWHGSLEPQRAATLKEVILGAPCPVIFTKVEEAAWWSQPRPSIH